ncbi:hypothetical protein DVA86_07040 [Streptomyces armeniacus]|uniref:Uncharacterized protein n=1 Tax=Streptomyces armeniacus TaxID=83291 RepID=A0A345XLC7_9ACTN|nr:hypothetical protein [Streptomyces armeniacus]AXK32443.1 hypothetical protein DVA86_07040 [Streptomyces armeniacus]
MKPARSGTRNKDEIDFRYHTGRFRTRDGNRLALLAAHREGSLEICRKQVAFTQNVDVDQAGPERQICVFTRDGHTALVTLRKPAPVDHATFTLSVWRDTSDPR